MDIGLVRGNGNTQQWPKSRYIHIIQKLYERLVLYNVSRKCRLNSGYH